MLSTEITRPLPGLDGIAPLGLVAPQMTIELGSGESDFALRMAMILGPAALAGAVSGGMATRRWNLAAGALTGVFVGVMAGIGGLLIADKAGVGSF